MTCCQCQGIESVFNKNMASRELKDYRKRGPDKTTHTLLNALKAAGVEHKSLLDIGGGVGAIQHELAGAGVDTVVNVDASTAYLEAAKQEASRQGYAERASYHFGDFVTLAPDIAPADIVTLDRVLCCYHDVEALVSLSAARATGLYGLVFPRDVWWIKFFRPLFNALFWITRNPYRFFVHASDTVETLAGQQGLKRRYHKQTFVWQIVVYEREIIIAP